MRLIDEGFFAADEQFELIDGFITPKMSRNPPHDAALNGIRRRLERSLAAGWIVRVQSALVTLDSVPEPDIAVVRGDDADYETRHPEARDTALVVEVANTSLAEDRRLKLQTYAQAGVGCYWIANVTDSQIESYTEPQSDGTRWSYRRRDDYSPADSIPIPNSIAGAVPSPLPTCCAADCICVGQANRSRP
jgi:Uma2 family endonuclease